MKHTAFSYKTIAQHILALLALVAMAGMLSNGCRRLETPNGPPDGSPISTTIVGQVTDESGAALSGVTVTAAGASTVTDANGLYSFAHVSVPSNRAFVIAKMGGYFDGARAGIPSANGVTYFPIRLTTKTAVGSIDASSGGSVSIGSAKLTLAPGGVINSGGAVVTGPVTVYARHLDPGNQNFSTLFPGDMMAQNADGSRTGLWSFGVLAAELRGPNNEVLQPAPGLPAKISLPVTSGQQSLAPSSVPLWYFDETLGLWKEQGSAVKAGNTYSGEVSHFSFWNIDMRCDWGYVKGQIVCNDVPIPGVKINFGAYVEGGQPNVVTDGGGYFSVRVPANMPNAVIMQVLASENNGLYYTNVPVPINAPKDGTLDLGQIALSSPCPAYLTGKLVDCNNQLTPGMIMASFNGGMNYVFTNDGNFRLIAPATQNILIAATAASGAVAQPQTLTAGGEGTQSSLPPIVACSNTPSEVRLDISGAYGSLLVFSPDGSKLATANSDATGVVILDASSGAVLHQISVTTTSLPLARVSFSPDGSKIITISGAQKPITRCPTTEVYSGSVDCYLLDGTKLTPAPLMANSAIFSNDGQDIYLSSGDSSQGPVLGLCDYNIAQAKVVKKFSAPSWYLLLGTATGGTQLELFGYNSLVFWDIATDKQVSSVSVSAGYSGLPERLSPDGSILGVDNNDLKFFNTNTGALLTTASIPAATNSSFEIMADDATFLAQYEAGGANTVGLFKVTDGTPAHIFVAPSSLGNSYAIGRSADGKLAAAIYNSEIRIWNVQ